MTTAGRVTAGLGPIVVHAEGARSFRDDYGVPEEFGTDTLGDSFAENSTYAFGASVVTDKGYVGAAYTRQDATYGLPGHSHANGVCHLHGYPFPAPGRIDLHCLGHGNYQNPFPNPDSDTALIDLRSERVDLRADLVDVLPGISDIRVRGSYTDYLHDEVDGPILYSRYANDVWDGRLELTHKPLLGFIGTVGVQYTDGTFSGLNLIDLHVPPTASFGFGGVQDYLTRNVGLFLSERRSFGSVDIEIAARKDWRTIKTPIPGDFYINLEEEYWGYYIDTYGEKWRQAIEQDYREGFALSNPDRKHDPFSASVGATWNVSQKYSVALSLAHTERAPNVRELFADGSSLATNSYEVGLLATGFVENYLPDDLFDYEDGVLERSRAINLTFRKVGGPFEFEIGAFFQDVDNYIFAHLLETEYTTGQRHDFLLYTTADAKFYGADGQVSYQLNPNSRITVFGDYVSTSLKNEEGNLPRIPPGRFGARYEYASGALTADLEYYRTLEQDRVASYERPTDGYNMLNATIAYNIDMGQRADFEVYARATNLTDELAFVHTSFVKDQSPLRGRNIVFGIRTQF
nr:TonB-dependent receptor [Qipengyuania aerophila]